MRIAIVILIPATAGVSALSYNMLLLFTTSDYAAASPIMVWVALGSCLYGASLLAYTGLGFAMKTGLIARNYLLAALVNIVLNLLFVPIYGYIAAAITTVVAIAFLLAINIISSSKYLSWSFPIKTFIRSLLSSVVMFLLLKLLLPFISFSWLAVLICVPVGIFIYFGLMFVLGELSQGERIKLKAMF
jgi:O-antigen/teichoic acid export membrane protein